MLLFYNCHTVRSFLTLTRHWLDIKGIKCSSWYSIYHSQANPAYISILDTWATMAYIPTLKILKVNSHLGKQHESNWVHGNSNLSHHIALHSEILIWVRSWRCGGCLVIWFCYHLIAIPGNKTAAPSWHDPYVPVNTVLCMICHRKFLICHNVIWATPRFQWAIVLLVMAQCWFPCSKTLTKATACPFSISAEIRL